MSDHTHFKLCHESTSNFDGATFEFSESISNIKPHFTLYMFIIALKSTVCGCPIWILWAGGPSCGWMWLTSFMGQPLFTLGLTCVCFVPRDFLPLQGGSSTNSIFFINFQNIILRTPPSLQKNPCRFKTGMEFLRQVSLKLKMSSIFCSHPWSSAWSD